ncbi:NblA/ycf18 family protein [Chroococcidiopsis sp. CCNUC1]|uniref:NblA/ycf18 family protein n=1 Tax=Chroococcidiopsis sp. CCNUC1 TaxID=2653189 RepID=UPI0020200711|nr:NblA/ycf18 family protein [Chroococcidiopsis sp. CCNUC1]URD53686.1 NblA/ycf18 family protein [Chroococcidiopsis sp. CCNUC1]
MAQTIELTLEQEFSLRNFADQVQQMSREQAQEFLLVQYKHMMIQETTYQELLKKDWKLDRDFDSLKTKNQ